MASKKLIGYLSYVTKDRLMCDGDSCVIAGSRKKMQAYIVQKQPEPVDRITISKAWFDDIRRGMELGAAYSFDEESYNRFYRLARKAGFNLGPENFTEQRPGAIHFVRVQKFSVSRN